MTSSGRSRHYGLALILPLWMALLLVSGAVAGAQAPPRPKTILLLNSLRPYTPWESQTCQSFQQALAAQFDGKFKAFEEYLDLAARSDTEFQEVLRDFLRVKYARRGVDLVITVNDRATLFMLQHGRELFPGVPLIMSGGGTALYRNQPERPQTTTVFREEDILAALKAALGLLPGTRHVFVVSGVGPFDLDMLAKARRQLAGLGDMPQVTYLTGMSLEQLQRRVAELPPDSLVFFLMMVKDSNGRVYVPRQACRLISNAANAPTIGMYDTFLDYGILGGRLDSAQANGRTLAEVAARVLNGQDAGGIPPTPVPAIIAYDWRQLKRWSLLGAPLPPGAAMRFRQYSFLELYWKWILAALALVALQTLFIAMLLGQITRKRREGEQRRKSEMALLESEQRYKQLFASDRVVQIIVDPQDGQVVEANEAACRFYGYPPEELTAKTIFDINTLRPEEIAQRMTSVESGSANRFQVRHRLASGVVRDVEVYSSPFTLQGRTLLHSTIFDITERKEAEEALRQSEAQFRTLVENAPLAIVIQTGGLISYINHQGVNAFGAKDKDELLGQPVLARIPPEFHERVRARIAQVNELRQTVPPWECQYLKMDGTPFEVDATSVPFRYQGRDGALVFFRDITSKKRDEKEKARLEEQLHQAQKMEAIGTLAGGIAHDFNNILGVMMGYSELLLEELKANQQPEQDIRQIIKAGERARDLVRQILTFSRKVEVELAPIDLNDEVRHTVDLLRRTLPLMIDITTSLSEDLLPVLANAQQLEQIILNLATNAQYAMPDGGRLSLATSNVTLDHDYCLQHLSCRPGRYALLQVTDTGCGMDEQARKHMFDPFFTTKRLGEGTGLGLSTVFGIVKAFGGHIYCYSELGQGTTFKIYLPAHTEGGASALAASAPAVEPRGGGETILLVDDDDALRSVSARVLARAGYRVLAAASGEDALDIYRERGREIALVLMDVNMPGMGGYKAQQAIMAIDPQAKIVIATGYAPNGAVRESLRAGALGYLAKPFQKPELLSMVRGVLDRD